MGKVLAWFGFVVLLIAIAGLSFNAWTEAKKDQNIFEYFEEKFDNADKTENTNEIESETAVISWEL